MLHIGRVLERCRFLLAAHRLTLLDEAALLLHQLILRILYVGVLLAGLFLELIDLGPLLLLAVRERTLSLLEGLPLLNILWFFVSKLSELTLEIGFQHLLPLGVDCLPLRLFLPEQLFGLLLACFDSFQRFLLCV